MGGLLNFIEMMAEGVKRVEQGSTRQYTSLMMLHEEANEIDGVKHFDPKAIAQAYKQNAMSRETVIHISPDQFLSLAAELHEPKPEKEQKVSQVLKDGKKFSDLPYLTAITNDKGDLEIDGHEGRHRMLALKAAGVKRVPVVLLSGDGGAKPGYRWGKSKDRPSWILGQDGRFSTNMFSIQTFEH